MLTDAQARCILNQRPDVGNYVHRQYPMTAQGGPAIILATWFQDVQGNQNSPDYPQVQQAGSDLDRYAQIYYKDCLTAADAGNVVIPQQALDRLISQHPPVQQSATSSDTFAQLQAWVSANKGLLIAGGVALLVGPRLLRRL